MKIKSGFNAITEKEIKNARTILEKYKTGKQNLENRIVEDEQWWEMRHWDVISKKRKTKKEMPEVTSAWLFSALLNKHADAMDNIPEPIVLPREESDQECAKILSDVLPVIMDYNYFEDVYSNAWWEKLKHGTAVYGCFWNSDKENGLGDIDIKNIDLLKIFWEPGITDIQDSQNLFIVELVDDNYLKKQYPILSDIQGDLSTIDIKQYIYDDNIDTSGKSVVVDWYYKGKTDAGKQVVHYVKFVGDTLLYASENDDEYRNRGFYDHGKYPVVFDCLFPEKGTPVGFGYVAVCKEPQLYIDKLSSNILENSLMNTKKRFFVSESANINEDEFKDWNNPIVHVTGDVSDTRIKEIICQPLSGIYQQIVNSKIEEMKETSGARDVNTGGASGVTAASAISALQEAGNKTSRDIIAGTYRKYAELGELCIELIRQFYDEPRIFRITEPGGIGYRFADISNSGIKETSIGIGADGAELMRKPIFDLKIKAQKKNPFSRMEENERAKEFYRLGFFNPENAEQSLACISMMNFEGKEELIEKLEKGATLLNMVQQLKEQNAQLIEALSKITGAVMPQEEPTMPSSSPIQAENVPVSAAQKELNARTPMMEKMAERAKPSMEAMSDI